MDLTNSYVSYPHGVGAEKTIQPETKRPRMESSVHPLLMDHVIEAVFDYAATGNKFCETVRQFRVVCSLWCKIATKKFRDAYGQMYFENDFDRSTARFIEVMQNCDDIPFKSFKFTGGFVLYKPYRGDFSYDRVFEKLLSVCSSAIQELEFSTHNPSDLKFPKLLCGIRFDNLRVLSFKMCVFYDRLQCDMPSLLETFFKVSPQLEKLELTVTTPDGETTEEQLKLIERFGDLIVSKLPKTCRHLKLNMPFTNTQLDRFGMQNVFLESLNVDFRNSHVSTSSLVTFLESQQHTLRDLQLIECPVRIVRDTLHFPSLMRLRIEGRAILPCFPFKKVFPVLETFEVVFYWIYQEDRWLSNVFGENTYSSTVKQLKICCWVTDSDSQIFQRISKNFPRLNKLQLNVDSFAVLKEIFKIMKGIEELEMSLGLEFWRKSGNEVDSVFTGLPEEYISNKSANFFSCTDMPTTLHEPSLSNMQKLKSLKIVAFQADEVKLTDVTVYYGFLKMKSLKHLTLDVFPVSENAIQSMKKSFNLAILPDRRHRAFCG